MQRLRKLCRLRRLSGVVFPDAYSREVADAIPNLQPRDDIWPTDKAPVIRRLEDGTNDFTELRWSFPPAQPKRPPAF